MTPAFLTRAPKPQSQIIGENLTRIQIERGLTLEKLIAITGLDERTLRGIKKGTRKTREGTLKTLAEKLGITTRELLEEPLSEAAHFDRTSNPVAASFVENNPRLFKGWLREDYDELFSRVGVGGGLTEAGVLAAAQSMNERRNLMVKVATLLETPSRELLMSMVEEMWKRETSFT